MNILRTFTAKHLGRRLIFGGKPFIAGIILHDTAGSGTHNDTRYLANPGDGRAVSCDYTIERDGKIYQLNPDIKNRCTWHAGRATRFKSGNRSLRNREVTQSLIGIELVQKANLSLSPIWPDPQVKAVAELCVFLCKEYALPKESITTHAAIITDGSRTDPRQFPFPSFWFYFNQYADPTASRAAAIGGVARDPEGLAAAVNHTVGAGDTLWGIAKKYGTSVEEIKAINAIDTRSNVIHPGQTLRVNR